MLLPSDGKCKLRRKAVTVTEESASEWVPPASFDGYRIVRTLGSGAMGRVYLGHDLLLDRPVAIKFMTRARSDVRRRLRFKREGQALARLSHPNVVLTFRTGTVEGHPFLVSELVTGQSLDQIARPVHWRRVLDIGIGLARGLAAVHRAGILHRDVKPQNVMLTAENEVKLIDFGVAAFFPLRNFDDGGAGSGGPAPVYSREPDGGTESDEDCLQDEPNVDGLSQSGTLVGTRRYLSPERLRGEAATPQSDIFSVGCVLRGLCAEAETSDGPRAVQVESNFQRIVDRCLEREPNDRYASADDLLAALETLADETSPFAGTIPPGNPYRGLEAFDADHRAFFLGRSHEVAALLQTMRTESVVAVAGDSGVGKSSLCKAGVLPHLREVGLIPGRPCVVAELTPGRDPMSRLAMAVGPLVERPAPEIRDQLLADPMDVLRAISSSARKASIVVFIDQIEEIFTLAPAAEAVAFASVVSRLASLGSQLRVLVTVRGDFLARLASVPGLGPQVARAPYLLRPLSPEKLRAVILVPARRSGVSFASQSTVNDLVLSALASESALPLLQFTLAELWETRDVGTNQIPADALARLGGLEGALESHAERLLRGLPAAQVDSARRLLLKLVTSQRTRAVLGRNEVQCLPAQDQATMESLIAARLVVVRGTDDLGSYELAHEALITRWTTLRAWLDEAMTRKSAVERLSAAAKDWETLGRRPDALWRGRRLVDILRLDLGDVGPLERAFLDASRHVRTRARLVRILAPLVLVGTLLFAIGGAHVRARAEIAAKIAHSRAVAARLEAEARPLDQQGLELRERAIRLFDQGGGVPPQIAGRDSWKEAENLWARFLDTERAAEAAYSRATSELDTALLVDPAAAPVREDLIRVLARRRLSAQRTYHHELDAELTSRLKALRDADRSGAADAETATLLVRARAGAGAQLRLARYEPDNGGRLTLTPAGPLEAGSQQLAPGSYLISVSFSGCEPMRLAVLLEHGEQKEVHLPAEDDCRRVPRGYHLVPTSESLTGSDEENIRAALEGAPLHEVRLPSYLIGKYEVTIGEYVRWLDALDPDSRARRTPKSHTDPSSVELSRGADGQWVLTLKPLLHKYVVSWGQELRYPARLQHATQDWRRFPVTGISFDDARAYARWLDGTGQLKGARVCSDLEWEKAARGADGRIFTTGRALRPSDANFAPTHGGTDLALGPDEVGSHHDSASPYGVEDLHGNAYEIVATARWDQQAAILGGSWDREHVQQRLDDRFRQDPNSRNAQFGFRLCADFTPFY